MHGDVSLGGPVWFFAQLVILGTVVMSIFVLVDSLTPRRCARVAGRLPEPLWLYSAVMGSYLVLLASVQMIPGLQFASAVAAIASPFALVLGVVYLLRAVFPKADADQGTSVGVAGSGLAEPKADDSIQVEQVTSEVETP